MICSNKFCIFSKCGQCSKWQIEIDVTGHCKDCIYVNISDEVLEGMKSTLEDEVIKQIAEREKF